MSKIDKQTVPAHLLAEAKRLAAETTAPDTSDAPEVTDWSAAERGRFWRPVKRQVTLRLDADLLEYFSRDGAGYQTRLNAALREWVEAHRRRSARPSTPGSRQS